MSHNSPDRRNTFDSKRLCLQRFYHVQHCCRLYQIKGSGPYFRPRPMRSQNVQVLWSRCDRHLSRQTHRMEQQGSQIALTSFFAVPVDLGAGRLSVRDINLEIYLRGTSVQHTIHPISLVTYKTF